MHQKQKLEKKQNVLLSFDDTKKEWLWRGREIRCLVCYLGWDIYMAEPSEWKIAYFNFVVSLCFFKFVKFSSLQDLKL